MKIPVITIVGIPNTGKSTLFNRLVGQRKALIHSKPGMTRDIYKKKIDIEGKTFYLQDTGGFFIDDEAITKEINKRVLAEAEKSDLVIFLFDGRRDILGYEKDLFLNIKKLNTNIIPVINKVDIEDKFILPAGYYSLKTDYTMISAEHNNNLDLLIEEITENFKDYTYSSKEETPPCRISFIGKPNVGKSSIINKILNDDHAIVSPVAGTTRDSVDLEIKRFGETYILVDNAGIRKLKKVKEDTESAAVIRAEKDIKNADIIIFVIDVSQKVDQTDMLIAKKILNSAKPVILAFNKWDLVNKEEDANKILNKSRKRFTSFYFAPSVLVSALSGKNIFELFRIAKDIDNSLHTKIKTRTVNNIMAKILTEKKLLTENNRPFSPKYTALESQIPFFITFKTNDGVRLKASDEKFLKKRLFEELDITGIPLYFKISAKKSTNR